MNILAIGGGGFVPTDRYGSRPGPLVDYALALTGTPTPRVCALYTATGDPDARIASWYAAWAGTGVRASHLALFPMPSVADVAGHLAAQDAVYVGGGSVANLLALWRLHGVDDALRAAWRSGVVLFGVSAGSLCWFAGGTTDSFGPDLRPVRGGLELVAASNCPHYNSEPQRRPLYRSLVAARELLPGWAADDGVGLHFVGDAGELTGALADRPDAYAWRVEPGPDGTALEQRITPRLLG